jgi:putative aldouronate transport system permease protein
LLNEIKIARLQRTIQTAIYLPHFISWVILAGILMDMLSPSTGVINLIIKTFGGEPVNFLADKKAFPMVLILSDTWKEFGFGTIVYLAALTSIDPFLYEAASIDGASRFRRIWHITLPSLLPTIILMSTLRLGTIMNAGFDQVVNLYSPLVYKTGDVIDTFVYRLGMESKVPQYELATTIGLFKSVISFGLVSASYIIAKKVANYRIF